MKQRLLFIGNIGVGPVETGKWVHIAIRVRTDTRRFVIVLGEGLLEEK